MPRYGAACIASEQGASVNMLRRPGAFAWHSITGAEGTFSGVLFTSCHASQAKSASITPKRPNAYLGIASDRTFNSWLCRNRHPQSPIRPGSNKKLHHFTLRRPTPLERTPRSIAALTASVSRSNPRPAWQTDPQDAHSPRPEGRLLCPPLPGRRYRQI